MKLCDFSQIVMSYNMKINSTIIKDECIISDKAIYFSRYRTTYLHCTLTAMVERIKCDPAVAVLGRDFYVFLFSFIS